MGWDHIIPFFFLTLLISGNPRELSEKVWPHILFVYFVKLAEVKVVFTRLTNICFLVSFFSPLINSAVRGKVNVKGVFSSNQHSQSFTKFF